MIFKIFMLMKSTDFYLETQTKKKKKDPPLEA